MRLLPLPFRLAVLCTASVLGLSSVAPATLAQAPTTTLSPGEQRIREGIERRQQGDDAGALLLFEQAWRLEPTPRARAQMARLEDSGRKEARLYQIGTDDVKRFGG